MPVPTKILTPLSWAEVVADANSDAMLDLGASFADDADGYEGLSPRQVWKKMQAEGYQIALVEREGMAVLAVWNGDCNLYYDGEEGWQPF